MITLVNSSVIDKNNGHASDNIPKKTRTFINRNEFLFNIAVIPAREVKIALTNIRYDSCIPAVCINVLAFVCKIFANSIILLER